MVAPRGYTKTRYTPIYMELECVGALFRTWNKGTEIRVDIRKQVEIRQLPSGREEARTYAYSYNANLPRGTNVLRYCSPHDADVFDASVPNHHKYHHRHDWSSGSLQIDLIQDLDQIPHVGEFLNEVLQSF